MRTHEIIGSADTTAEQPRERRFRFTFVGWRDGWYVLLLRAQGHPGPEILSFRKRVLQWLIDQEITPNILSRMADSNAADELTGSSMDRVWLLLRRASDALRVEREFGVRGITPKTMFAAVRAEASIRRSAHHQ